MERLLVAGVLLVGAVALALVLRRRGSNEPVRTSWAVPTWVDRADFASAATPWLVVVFTSATCRSCRDTVDKARPLESDDVAVREVEVAARPDLHQRYGIEAVPTVVIADADIRRCRIHIVTNSGGGRRAMGHAGKSLKGRLARAILEQGPRTPSALINVEVPGLTVLDASRHQVVYLADDDVSTGT